MIRILVCGGRDYKDAKKVDDVLFDVSGLEHQYTYGTIIHGNAKGVDTLAASWGYRMGWEVKAYPADWDKYGKAAGPIRNQQMIDEGKPDLVIAFPGDRGTANMIELAKKAGLTVMKIV